MALSWIKARHTCDRCGVWFEVEFDAAYVPPALWSLHDVATDAVRGGQVTDVQNYTQDKVEKALGIFALSCSMDGDDALCGACTKKADDAYFAETPRSGGEG